MDRNEAVLRELNLYPLWKRRGAPAPVAAEQQMSEEFLAVRPDIITDGTASHLTDETPSHSTRLSKNDSQVAGYNPAKYAGQVIGYSHSTKLSKNDSQVAGYEPVEGHVFAADVVRQAHPERTDERSGVNNIHADSSAAIPTFQIDNLDWPELKQRVHDCTACKLRAGCTQTVFGVGDEQADWLFVGEGPGADEDAQGEPFVGQAGKLLDNMLLAIKLKRGNNVYIANIVKCRPPNNRMPEPDEIAQCLPYLKRQIELIQPKLIVALGKIAATVLLMKPLAIRLGESTTPAKSLVMGKEATLGSLRGTLHDYNGIPLLVTYHPAYLLRSPMEKAKAWQDLCLAANTMAG